MKKKLTIESLRVQRFLDETYPIDPQEPPIDPQEPPIDPQESVEDRQLSFEFMEDVADE